MATANALFTASAVRAYTGTGASPTPSPGEPPWLHTAGQIAGVALMIELLLALLIFAALMVGLAYGAWWLSRNVVPVIGEYSAQAQQYIGIAEQGSDRVAHSVAAFHGARHGIVAGLKAFFLPGPRRAPPTRPLTPTPNTGVRPQAPRPAGAADVTARAGAAPQPGAPGAAQPRQAATPATQTPAPHAVTPIRPTPPPGPRVFRASGQVAGRAAGRIAS
jgi:hypothetical protein